MGRHGAPAACNRDERRVSVLTDGQTESVSVSVPVYDGRARETSLKAPCTLGFSVLTDSDPRTYRNYCLAHHFIFVYYYNPRSVSFLLVHGRNN